MWLERPSWTWVVPHQILHFHYQIDSHVLIKQTKWTRKCMAGIKLETQLAPHPYSWLKCQLPAFSPSSSPNIHPSCLSLFATFFPLLDLVIRISILETITSQTNSKKFSFHQLIEYIVWNFGSTFYSPNYSKIGWLISYIGQGPLIVGSAH